MTYESISLTQLTGNMTGYYVLQGIGSLILVIAVTAIVYKIYKWFVDNLNESTKVIKAQNYYKCNAWALKTGIIQKISEDKNIPLVFEPIEPEIDVLEKLYSQIRSEVAKDFELDK